MSTSFDDLQRALADRYRLERELGQGGMATVYLARDLRHDRDVALKVLRPDLAAILGGERFLNEVRITARLDHPHILHLIDSGECGGFLWYALPYVRGESLRDRLRREPQLPLDDTLAITRQLAGALDYAHRQGVIHRDLKPENVLLFEGEAMLADFGIALAVREAGGARLTETGISLGTPQYMSPEQATGERHLDARSDVYSLGAVVYEMLAGEPPLSGATAQAVIAKLMTTEPVSLGVLRPALPAGVQKAVRRALAKVPADRFGSAGEFAAALGGGKLASRPALPPARPAIRRLRAGIGVAALAIIAFAGYRLWPRPVAPHSIAVLPFDNVGGDPENRPFSDGIADELANQLGQVVGLEVAPRTSAFALSARGLTATEIGNKLAVGYVLAGSLRRDGDQMRVIAELIQVGDGRRVWSQEYRNPSTDMFATEDEITGSIVGALKVRLSVTDPAGLARRRTVNPEAHDLYLRGRYFFDLRGDTVTLSRAQDYFEQAIRADSTYALAWAGLSDALSHSAIFGRAKTRAVYAPAVTAARRALALDSTLVEAHTSLGFISLFLEWDWPAADRELQTAIALDPRHSPAHLYRAWSYVAVDSLAQAVQEGRTAVQLEPLSLINNVRLADFLNFDGQHEAALGQVRSLLELAPDYGQAKSALAKFELDLGRCDQALAAAAGAPVLTATGYSGIRGHVFARCGHRDEAKAEIDRLAGLSRNGGVGSHFSEALIYTDLGDRDRALAQLDSAMLDREWILFTLPIRPEFNSLRGDRRFKAILDRITPGLAPPRQE